LLPKIGHSSVFSLSRTPRAWTARQAAEPTRATLSDTRSCTYSDSSSDRVPQFRPWRFAVVRVLALSPGGAGVFRCELPLSRWPRRALAFQRLAVSHRLDFRSGLPQVKTRSELARRNILSEDAEESRLSGLNRVRSTDHHTNILKDRDRFIIAWMMTTS